MKKKDTQTEEEKLKDAISSLLNMYEEKTGQDIRNQNQLALFIAKGLLEK